MRRLLLAILLASASVQARAQIQLGPPGGVQVGGGAGGGGAGCTLANPTAKVGLTAVNGSASTCLRSDAAPPLDQTISPTMTGNWVFTPASGAGPVINPVTNTTALTISGASHTGSDATSDFSDTVTVSTTGAPDLWAQHVTWTTTSGTFVNFFSGATSEFSVSSDSTIRWCGPNGGGRTGGRSGTVPGIFFGACGGTPVGIGISGGVVFIGLDNTPLYPLEVQTLYINGTSTILSSPSAAITHFGDADVASPIAQTIGVQGVVAGTTNTAGANWTIAGSVGTGSGGGGKIIFQTAAVGGSGTTQDTLTTALTLDNAQDVLVAGTSAIATTAVAPFLFATTMAGAPTGTPTARSAGQSAIVIDSTDHKICWYEQANSAWKCALGS